MPVLLASIAAKHGMMVRNSKFLKVRDPGFRGLPLLPNKTPQPAYYPDVQPLEEGFCFRQTKVTPPANKIAVQFLDNLLQALATTAAGQLPDFVLEAFEALHMDANLNI